MTPRVEPGPTARRSLAGSVLTPSGWIGGEVVIAGDRIASVLGAPLAPGRRPDAPLILPGFIDLHVHGGDGCDTFGVADEIRAFIRFHASHGTVAMAPTTSTAPVADLDRALATIEAVRGDRQSGEATVLGAHLEGPFLNPLKLGAQMNVPLAGDVALALRWAAACKLVVATVAPEIPGGMAVVEALAARGCRVQVGHSLADAGQVAEAFSHGMTGFTHLFNAMSGVDHRRPGVAAYALARGVHAELICDLLHVEATVMLAAYRAIPRLYAITDATTFAGRPDGRYDTGRHRIVKQGRRITLDGGDTLAGSAITMLDAFRNLVGLGLSLAEASDLCATRQADYVGRADLGRLAPGALASLVVLDADLRLLSVWVEGEELTPR